MSDRKGSPKPTGDLGVPLPPQIPPKLPIVALGMSLGSFLAITYVLCVLFDLWFPALAMNPLWSKFLPGFVWLTWPSFFLGLIEAFAYGWYVALVFGPLFNLFSAWQFRLSRTPAVSK